jgi:hypothetical protein
MIDLVAEFLSQFLYCLFLHDAMVVGNNERFYPLCFEFGCPCYGSDDIAVLELSVVPDLLNFWGI